MGEERPKRADEAITCLLVDDHPSVLDAVEALLKAEGITVVGRAVTGAEALAFSFSDAAVVVTDLRLPDVSGLEIARELLRRDPARAVVVYSATITAGSSRAALESGIRGVVLKGSIADELPTAIRVAARGGTYLDPLI